MTKRHFEWSSDLIERVGQINDAFQDIYIPTPSHQAIHQQCEILRFTNRNRRGKPMGALRLSQLSSAGKTACFENYHKETLAKHERLTGKANPYLILYVSLLSVTTPKALCQTICRQLGDENWEVGRSEDLIHRMRAFIPRAGVEMIIIDEVQELKGARKDRADVTNLLKSLLNTGIAPLVLVGDETSKEMFDNNVQLANRAGAVLELTPFDPNDKARLGEFKTFCIQLDQEMIKRRLVRHSGVLCENYGMRALLKWSGGHLGRVSRIVAQALEHVTLRCATAVERQDLDYAIQNFAIPNNYRIS